MINSGWEYFRVLSTADPFAWSAKWYRQIRRKSVPFWHSSRVTDGRTDRQTDRQTDKKANSLIDRTT